MNEESRQFTDQTAAFQKIWLESMSKLMQAAFTFSPNSAPPELLREIRNGILKALGESWNEFMRSPQFQENMKQWMDNAMAFRKLSHDFMAKVHKEMQTPSRDDIDTIQLNMRHLETRILDQLEVVSKQVEALNGRIGAARTSRNPTAAAPNAAPPPRAPRNGSRRQRPGSKAKTP